MRKKALFVFAVFARFSLDSARTKIPIARMAASQKINGAALDIFILLVFFYAPAFGISLCRNAADSLRFSAKYCAGAGQEGKQTQSLITETAGLRSRRWRRARPWCRR